MQASLKKILHCITNVPQLNGILKTQLEEQLNFSVNKNTRFVSQMKPINHLFLFCCIMNIRIKKINDKTANNLEATPSFTVIFDIKGHAVMDLLKKLSNASVTGKK